MRTHKNQIKKKTMKTSNTGLLSIAILSFATLFLFGCDKEDTIDQITPPTYERGEIIQSNSLGVITKDQIQLILAASNVQLPFDLSYDVDVYSIHYSTIDGGGNPISTSGAIFIPVGVENLPMLSLQHGTESKRDLVASVQPNNSTEGIIGLITASIGYYTVVPDYPGFGISMTPHPYHHAESIYPSVIDFMRAGKTVSSSEQITLNEQVFLTGYSEGGYVTLATQKAIEKNHSEEFNLIAVAPLAGPYDLKGMFDTVFTSTTYPSTTYIAYFLTAYNEIYGWNRLDDFFKGSVAAKVQGLFNGSKTWGEIGQQLPATFSELVNAEFAANYVNGNEADFDNALKENTLLDWTPIAPVHFFHGDADALVPYQNALTAVERFTENGAEDIQLTNIPGGTHETSGLPAILGAIEWFGSFEKNISSKAVRLAENPRAVVQGDILSSAPTLLLY